MTSGATNAIAASTAVAPATTISSFQSVRLILGKEIPSA
jgi:hypothetical protein